jgi:hypothetical protein
MDRNRIQDIKRTLEINSGYSEEFIILLTDLHSVLKSTMPEVDPWSEWADPDEFGGEEDDAPDAKSQWLDKLNSAFDNRKLDGVASLIMANPEFKMEHEGWARSLMSTNLSLKNNIILFLVNYGFNNFIEDTLEAGDTAILAEPLPAEEIKSPEPEGEPAPTARPSSKKREKGKKRTRRDGPRSRPSGMEDFEHIYWNMRTDEGFFGDEYTALKEGGESPKNIQTSIFSDNYYNDNYEGKGFRKTYGLLSEDTLDGFDIDEENKRLTYSQDKMDSIIGRLTLTLRVFDEDLNREASISLKAFADRLSGDSKRRSFTDRLDLILASIKQRDLYVRKRVKSLKERGYHADGPLTQRGNEIAPLLASNNLPNLFNLILSKTEALIFPVLAGGLGVWLKPKSFSRENWRNAWAKIQSKFEEKFRNTIKSKSKEYLSLTEESFSYCRFMVGSISTSRLLINTWKEEHTTRHSEWRQMSCPTCKKIIFTPKREIIKGKRRDSSHAGADYQPDVYSLFREDGTPILQNELYHPQRLFQTEEEREQAESQGITAPGWAPPAGYSGGKTWAEIQELIASGNEEDHLEGLRRRASVLKSLGAKRLTIGSKSKGTISDIRYICPYTKEEDRPSALLSDDVKQKFECGLYLDVDSFLDKKRANPGYKIDPRSLQSSFSEGSASDSVRQFEQKLQQAETEGYISEGQKIILMNELMRRRGGGWRFSYKSFNCPTKIPTDGVDGLGLSSLIEKFSFIATPLAGPINEARLDRGSLSADNYFSHSEIHPPLNIDGSLATADDLGEGTLSYLICGAPTSLSSFSRDANEKGSLPRLIQDLIAEMSKGSLLQSRAKLVSLVNTLLSLGVDFDDIMPFMSTLTAPMLTEDTLGGAIDTIEKSGRLHKIAHILAIAMSSAVNLESSLPGSGDGAKYLESIGDLNLVCGHGHRFAVRDSVYFGRTHTGFRTTAGFNIAGSRILETRGAENFNATLLLQNKRGKKYINSIDSATIGVEKHLFKNWSGKKRIRSIGFEGLEDDAFYSFEQGRQRFFIWGSESQYGDWTSASSHEETIRGTERYETQSEDSLDSQTEAGRNRLEGQLADQMDSPEDKDLLDRDKANKAAEHIEGILHSILINIKEWLALSTTLEVRGLLSGKPVTFMSVGDSSPSKVQAELQDRLSEITKKIMGILAAWKNEEAPLDDMVNHFMGTYFKALEEMNIDFIGYWGKSLSPMKDKNIINGIIRSMKSGGQFSDLPQNIERRLEYILQLNSNGESIAALLDSFRGSFSVFTPSKDQMKAIFSPPAGGDSDLADYSYNVGPSLIKMKGREFMGRVLYASSAMYLADMISNTYNTYMVDGSPKYIGYNLYDLNDDLLDLSTAEKVLGLSIDDISSIRIKIALDKAGEEVVGDLRANSEARNCILELSSKVYILRTACTAEKYITKGKNYIHSLFLEILEEEKDSLDRETYNRASAIVAGVMNNAPFTTMNLGASGKYKRFYGGETEGEEDAVSPSDPHALMPLFSTYTVEHMNAKEYYPIFLLTYKAKRGGQAKSYHNFSGVGGLPDIGVKEAYVLSRFILPDAESYSDETEEGFLSEVYRKNGWKLFKIKIGKTYQLKLKRTQEGIKGVSLIYHPGTSEVFSHSEEAPALLGYENDELNFNSTHALSIGQVGPRVGAGSLFPPHPKKAGAVGVPIPIDFQNKSGRDPLFPIIEIRMPVTITIADDQNKPKDVTFDISDFLLRDPIDVSFKILKEIISLKGEYEREKSRIISQHSWPLERVERELRPSYASRISDLFDSYRSLPYYVESAASATRKVGGLSVEHFPEGQVGKSNAQIFEGRRHPYLPLMDWATMHKILTMVGPSWGGHQLWSKEGEKQKTPEYILKRNAITDFLIKIYGLEQLSNLMNEVLKKEIPDVIIAPEDLLAPDVLIQRLVARYSDEKISKLFKKYFGYDISSDDAGGFAWANPRPGSKAVQTNLVKHFEAWVMGSESFFSIGVDSERSETTQSPNAYIKMMNVVFASNIRPKKKRERGKPIETGEPSQREALERVRDPDSPEILTDSLLYAHEYYNKAKGRISVRDYADRISDYLVQYIESSDSFIKESLHMVGHIKYSEKLKTHLYRRSIIKNANLNALWRFITR